MTKNTDMQYVRMGNTGLRVSRLSLGCMTYGSKKWREWVLEENDSRPFIQRALELGINFFDTADMYSLGVSEEILGRALRDFAPQRDRASKVSHLEDAVGTLSVKLDELELKRLPEPYQPHRILGHS